MTAPGTNAKCRPGLEMAAVWGRPDISRHVLNDAKDPFETLCLPQRALPAVIEVGGSQFPRRRPGGTTRTEGHNFDSSNCCRSPIHILARSASSLLAWSALPRAL